MGAFKLTPPPQKNYSQKASLIRVNITSKCFSFFNNKAPVCWVTYITRGFIICYSCLYYSFLVLGDKRAIETITLYKRSFYRCYSFCFYISVILREKVQFILQNLTVWIFISDSKLKTKNKKISYRNSWRSCNTLLNDFGRVHAADRSAYSCN